MIGGRNNVLPWTVLGFAVYFLVGMTVNGRLWYLILNSAVVSLGIGAIVVYSPALWLLFNLPRGAVRGRHLTVLAWILMIFAITYRAGHMWVWRALNEPAGMLDSVAYGIGPFAAILGIAMSLVVAETLDHEPPSALSVLLGASVSIGVLLVMSFAIVGLY